MNSTGTPSTARTPIARWRCLSCVWVGLAEIMSFVNSSGHPDGRARCPKCGGEKFERER